MSDLSSQLDVRELATDAPFAARPIRERRPQVFVDALQRVAEAFANTPDAALQVLVEAAMEITGADSAGISLQHQGDDGEFSYHWVATTGEYGKFLNAMLPSEPSACGVTIQRNSPQLWTFSTALLEALNVDAAEVTDGILIPWHEDGTSGTIWLMAHGRREAFDLQDAVQAEMMAKFAVSAARQYRLQKEVLAKARAAAASDMAHELAHQINNPLQSLTNLMHLVSDESSPVETIQKYARDMEPQLKRLSELVGKLLASATKADL